MRPSLDRTGSGINTLKDKSIQYAYYIHSVSLFLNVTYFQWCTYSDEDEILISSEENYKPNKKEETKTFNTNAAQQQQESLIAQY